MESKKWRTNSTYHWMKSAHKDNMAPGQSHAEWHKQHMNKPILHFEIEAPNVQLNPTTTKQLSPWLQFNWGTWRYNLFTSPTIDANSQIWMQGKAPIGLLNGFGIHGIQDIAFNLEHMMSNSLKQLKFEFMRVICKFTNKFGYPSFRWWHTQME